jgi:transcriptional regulator with XRE-family HTH domain
MSSKAWIGGIPPGMGGRLKEERLRLGKTQAELAEAGGVGRLSQIQYENETTAPSTRYLSGIAAVGVDLSYLLLGVRLRSDQISHEQEERVDKKAFAMIEKYARTQPNGYLDPEMRRVLYRILQSCLIQIELGSLPPDFDPATLLPGDMANTARSAP